MPRTLEVRIDTRKVRGPDHGVVVEPSGAIVVAGEDRLVAAGTQDGVIHAVRLTSTAPTEPQEQPQDDGHGDRPQPSQDQPHHDAGTPTPPGAPAPGGTKPKGTDKQPRRCVSRRYVTYTLKAAGLKRGTLTAKDAKGHHLAAKRVKRTSKGLRLDLSGLAKGEYRITIAGTTAKGKARRVTRTLRTGAPRSAT
ncbi:MAG TPA: hypothetical protein VFG42_08290 [Baekduia sp.]|uniref:hypothetical protein n=1 Tax=Baekduia sp. TaxID=2600305 RepID=UPI002D76B76C|nr:hypothetical protein [Baekduia sp.]HET6506774.1 hypothetical protein [Baekduia sp.]